MFNEKIKSLFRFPFKLIVNLPEGTNPNGFNLFNNFIIFIHFFLINLWQR